MTIKIYKGTDEIGGSCVELKTKNTTILLDYGTPLQDTSNQVKITDNIDAILISHPHQDHFGEIVNIEKTIPVYCGELSLELMNATKIFTGNEILANNFQLFEAWKSFEIGEFKVTPYLVDHSATDAYAFLIEADGKKVLYSGDFRANGRKAKLFDKMINDKNLKDLDILLMEGTMLQRSNEDFPDEQSVENKIFETIKQNNQISFMIGSSQNIDSIVSSYRACKKANKIFVIDIYTAFILEKMQLASSSIPNISWDNVKVIKKFGGSYYQKLQENKEYFKDYTSKVFDNIIDIDDIKSDPQNYFLKISPWHIDRVLEHIEVDTSNIIYSQWKGYLKEEFSNTDTVELFKNLQDNNNWVYAHTSGHADLPALQKFASSLSAKKLIPIHTEFKDKFAEHFDNVMILDDNESFDINDFPLDIYDLIISTPKSDDENLILKKWLAYGVNVNTQRQINFHDDFNEVVYLKEPLNKKLFENISKENKTIYVFKAIINYISDYEDTIYNWFSKNNIPKLDISNNEDFGTIILHSDDNIQIIINSKDNVIKDNDLNDEQVNELNELFKDDFCKDEDKIIEEWIGIDLDGTLAYYDDVWRGIEHIGEPIKPMIEFVKDLVSQGKKIKIFTARAKNKDTIPYIQKWLKKNNLPEFEVTNEKDFGMIMLYDDRCHQVITNSGEIVKKEEK